MPKKLPKNSDLAAGFFSKPSPADSTVAEKITAPPIAKKEKNPGGRPRKDGLKNEQFSLTMHPEIYEKLRILSQERTRGNFSALIDEAIRVYCKETKTDLADIEVDESIMDAYRARQAKKSKKKVNSK